MHLAAGSEAIAAVGTFVVAAAAAYYAKRQVDAAAEDRSQRQRPFVVVDLVMREDTHGLMCLLIENVGQTVARDVQIVIEPDPSSDTEEDSSERFLMKFLAEPIPTLPPGRRLQTIFTSLPHRPASLPRRFEVCVTCKDYQGKSAAPETYVLDLDVFEHLTVPSKDGLHELNSTVKQLTKTLNGVVSSGLAPKGVRVYAVTEQERRAAEEQALVRRQEGLAQHQRLVARLTPDDPSQEP